MDFRTQAAEFTQRAMEQASCPHLADLEMSGCLPVPGGRRWQAVFEFPMIILSTLLLLGTFAILPLGVIGILPGEYVPRLLLIGLLIATLQGWVSSRITRFYINGREGSFRREFPQLKSRPVGLEDAETYLKTKILPEDEGVCLLDPEKRRILVDGCVFRHVIWARDVLRVEPVSGYAISGANITCKLGGQELAFVLKSSGHGPIGSIVQALVPSANAKNLARSVNEALSDTPEPIYTAPPPPRDGG